MKFRIKYADQVVGVFILAALALVVAALLFIAVNQRWFVHNTVFKSQFTSANSISIGTPISLRGFEIGKISKLSLNDNNLVDIEFYVYTEYLSKVTMNSVLELSTSPIGLGTSLLFHKGKSSQALAEQDFIPALDSDKGRAMEAAGLIDMPKKDDTITRLLATVNQVLDNVNTTVEQLNGRLAGDKKGPIRDVIDNVNTITMQMNGSLGGARKGPIREVLDNLNLTLGGVNQTVATLGPKAAITIDSINQSLPALLTELQATLANVQTLTAALKDPNGLVPRLLGDDKLMPQVDTILVNLNGSLNQVQSILSGVNAEVPKLSSMMTEVRAAIASAQDVMQGLKNNPLLKGGIVEKPQQQALFQSLRKEEF